jgi:hypothetical protein
MFWAMTQRGLLQVACQSGGWKEDELQHLARPRISQRALCAREEREIERVTLSSLRSFQNYKAGLA